MYLITTRPIEDALNDCRILNKRGVNATASPSMKIKKENPHINFNFDGIFLTSRHAAHIVKNLKDKRAFLKDGDIVLSESIKGAYDGMEIRVK